MLCGLRNICNYCETIEFCKNSTGGPILQTVAFIFSASTTLTILKFLLCERHVKVIHRTKFGLVLSYFRFFKENCQSCVKIFYSGRKIAFLFFSLPIFALK